MTRAAVVAAGVTLITALGPVVSGSAPARAQGRVGPTAKKLQAEIAAHRAALSGTDADKAIGAAQALGGIADAAALDALLDALALGVAPDVAVAVLASVQKHADPRCFDTLAFYARYRGARVRAAAVEAMGALDDRRSIGPILAALSDGDKGVRAIAIGIVAARDMRPGIEPMLELLEKGEEATVPALASMANPDLAKALGEFIGDAPAPLLSNTLGQILLREDFGPEAARVQVVRTLAKIAGKESLAALQRYVKSLPGTSPRQSLREAKAIIADKKRASKPAPGGKQP